MNQFKGFVYPKSNYFSLPNEWTDITHDMTSLAEMKLVEYVLRHTWGYKGQEDQPKRITIDEFVNGRKKRGGGRIDRGTGLSVGSVSTGLRAAVKHGYLKMYEDKTDAGRVKRYYSLVMYGDEENDEIGENDEIEENAEGESEEAESEEAVRNRSGDWYTCVTHTPLDSGADFRGQGSEIETRSSEIEPQSSEIGDRTKKDNTKKDNTEKDNREISKDISRGVQGRRGGNVQITLYEAKHVRRKKSNQGRCDHGAQITLYKTGHVRRRKPNPRLSKFDKRAGSRLLQIVTENNETSLWKIREETIAERVRRLREDAGIEKEKLKKWIDWLRHHYMDDDVAKFRRADDFFDHYKRHVDAMKRHAKNGRSLASTSPNGPVVAGPLVLSNGRKLTRENMWDEPENLGPGGTLKYEVGFDGMCYDGLLLYKIRRRLGEKGIEGVPSEEKLNQVLVEDFGLKSGAISPMTVGNVMSLASPKKEVSADDI